MLKIDIVKFFSTTQSQNFMNYDIDIGDRVKIGERGGEVFKIAPLP